MTDRYHQRMTIRRLDQEELFSSGRFGLYRETWQTPDGEVTKPIIHHPGAVAIIAQTDPDHLLMVRQWRYPIGAWTLEIPAGTIDPGESPETTVAREIREETGFRAERFDKITEIYPAVGVSDEIMYFFRAHELSHDPLPPDQGELIEAVNLPLSEVADKRAEGLICDGKTIMALQFLGISAFQ